MSLSTIRIYVLNNLNRFWNSKIIKSFQKISSKDLKSYQKLSQIPFSPEGIIASSQDVWSNQASSRRYQVAPLLPASRKNVSIDVHRSTKRSIDRSIVNARQTVRALHRHTHTHVHVHTQVESTDTRSYNLRPAHTPNNFCIRSPVHTVVIVADRCETKLRSGTIVEHGGSSYVDLSPWRAPWAGCRLVKACPDPPCGPLRFNSRFLHGQREQLKIVSCVSFFCGLGYVCPFCFLWSGLAGFASLFPFVSFRFVRLLGNLSKVHWRTGEFSWTRRYDCLTYSLLGTIAISNLQTGYLLRVQVDFFLYRRKGRWNVIDVARFDSNVGRNSSFPFFCFFFSNSSNFSDDYR